MAKGKKYQQVIDGLMKLIDDGVLGPGDMVPSVRKLSSQWNVSISTVLTAYYRLEAQGILTPRSRSGFYVSSRLPTTPPEPGTSAPDSDPASVSMRDLITMIILRDAADPALAKLGTANPELPSPVISQLNRCQAALGRRLQQRSAVYTPPTGDPQLKRQLARLAMNCGCSLEAEEIVVTAGCAEAIFLSLKAVCREGDTVAVESPICPDVFQCLEILDLKALEIPTHPREGISLQALRFALANHSVQACLVVSNFSNPLGSCIPDQRKKELVELLAEAEIPLIENDIFGDLHYAPKRPAAAKSYDKKGLVLWCSSFSKSLTPGMRVGWCAPGRFKERLNWLKYGTTLATATLPQMTMAVFLAEGGYGQHLKRMRRQYREQMSSLRRAVFQHFPKEIRVTDPQGGYLLWVELPKDIDALTLYREAKKLGISFTPGQLFSVSDRYRNCMRLSAANWSAETEFAIKRLGGLILQLIRER